jgi:hypothetical protein
MPLHLSYHPRFHHYRSSTYIICIPRKQCLERLQTYFPTTFADWDRRREPMSLAPDGHYVPRHEIFSPIHVINLARELDLGSILPAAFYNPAHYGVFASFANGSITKVKVEIRSMFEPSSGPKPKSMTSPKGCSEELGYDERAQSQLCVRVAYCSGPQHL